MRNIRHAAAGLVVAGTLALGAAPAQAALIPIELVLAIDASGSISNADYNLQRSAYVNVLSSALIPIDGTMAIGVLQFGANTGSVFDLLVIDSQADKDALVAALTAMTRAGINTGGTAIGSAIDMAQGWLAGLNFANDNQVIDVSTDGSNNTGGSPITAANAAFAAGTTTNCLGVGAGATCNFETGFEILVNDFADFQTALERKIAQETGQTPEPTTMLLLGLGLAGAFVSRKRQ